MPRTRNALCDQTSPYLLQHRDNPVHWYPWGEEALSLARELDRPILLSIGYSACHWCHVMAHESFEDAATAEVMNELFINIKVDREERPDLDRIYQAAHQLLNQRPGGWPLTVFLSPDRHIPFFAGTYFPAEPRHNLPAFSDLLRRVAEVYRRQPDDIERQTRAVAAALEDLAAPPAASGAVLDDRPLDTARRQLESGFDARLGGFGRAPKFPHPGNLEFLLRLAVTRSDAGARHMALFTLTQMAQGGLYDQLGGGFCRYSVDDAWDIPHFEKMLYDNGPLLALYAEASQLEDEPLFSRVAGQTAAWVMREMQAPEGGYYAALDADSEGEEGRFYVWRREDVAGLLEDGDYRLLARHYGLDRPANFEDHWHLRVHADEKTLAREEGVDPAWLHERLEHARQTLFEARARRVRPGRDEKILAAWNGLMIHGMATAGRILDRPELIDSARRAVDFIREEMWPDGRLRAAWKDGEARLNAYLDDHAFLLHGLLALLEADWRGQDLHFATGLADALLERFEDRENGGFFFTAHDHEDLIQRPKPFADESMPAGNGIAALALARLGHLLGEPRYIEAAQRTLRAGWRAIEHLPHAHNALLLALEEYLHPPRLVILRGQPDDMRPWQQHLHASYDPRQHVFAIAADETGLPNRLADKRPADNGVVAYVCAGMSCQPAVTTLAELDAVPRR